MPKRKFQDEQDGDAVSPDPPYSVSELARLRTEQLLLRQRRDELLRQAREILLSKDIHISQGLLLENTQGG